MEELFRALDGPDVGATLALGIGVWLVMLLVMSGVVMLLWNWLMPGLFRLPALRYIQAVVMTLLLWILTGGGPVLNLSYNS